MAPDIPIPNPRGASTHVFELARALGQLGDEVHVVCRREGSQKSEEKISGVSFHRVYRGVVGPLSGKGNLAGADTETQGVQARAYNLYLQSFNALFVGVFASKLARDHRLQVIIERETAFGAGAVASLISHRPMVLELIGPRYSKLSAAVCSRVLAYNEKMVPRGTMGKTVFVKAAVNLDLFKPDPIARSSVRKRLGLEGSTVVGYVGTAQSWHGIEDLISASRKLRESVLGLKYLLVGPMPAKVRALAGSDPDAAFILAGTVPYPEVADYINACDIMVAPYNILKSSRRAKGIGSPLKVLEYMACGKAVIGSDLPQVADIIDDRETGLLFTQGNPDLLADRIEELSRDGALRESLGSRAIEKVRREFSWLSFARRVNSELINCVNTHAS
ncbi:MAG: glycosyltransferase family 4 protein [Thaumarchaeota archaeon]|nr:glycosyltransferase family 4 protein [Nitrososphaerota archaeon]